MSDDEFERIKNANTDALTELEFLTFDMECKNRNISNPHKQNK